MATQNRHGRFLSVQTKKDIDYKELSKKELLHIENYLKEFYDIEPSLLNEYLFIKRGEDVWVTTKKSTTVMPYSAAGLQINSIGFRAIRNSFQTNPKITTNFAQLLGNKIKKNIYFATKKEIEELLKGYDLTTKEDLFGYCVIKYDNKVICVGQYKDGNIKNQIPKGRTLHNVII